MLEPFTIFEPLESLRARMVPERFHLMCCAREMMVVFTPHHQSVWFSSDAYLFPESTDTSLLTAVTSKLRPQGTPPPLASLLVMSDVAEEEVDPVACASISLLVSQGIRRKACMRASGIEPCGARRLRVLERDGPF